MIIMDKLNAIEARVEDNFTQVHSQMGELRYAEFQQQFDGVKKSIKKLKNRSKMLGELSRMLTRNQRRTKIQADLSKKCSISKSI